MKTGLPVPRRTSDFVSARQFHRFAIYNEFYRKFGIDRQMVCGLSVSSTLTLMLTLNRQKKDFTESHRRQIALYPSNAPRTFARARVTFRGN